MIVTRGSETKDEDENGDLNTEAGSDGSNAGCVVCGRLVSTVDCDRCERTVCVMHYDSAMGFCGECAARAKPDDRRGDTFLF